MSDYLARYVFTLLQNQMLRKSSRLLARQMLG